VFALVGAGALVGGGTVAIATPQDPCAQYVDTSSSSVSGYENYRYLDCRLDRQDAELRAIREALDAPSPAPSVTASRSATPSASVTPSVTPTPTITPTRSATPSPSSTAVASHAEMSGIAEPYHLWSGLSASTINSRMAKLAATGVKWFRMDLPAVYIETSQGSRNWTAPDRIQSAAKANGLKVIWCVSTLPAWSASSWDVGPTTTAQRTAFANFAAAAVTHFKGSNVAAWEIWNEPNLATFWTSPNVARYADLIKATYPAVKAADPDAYVLTGGTAWNDSGRLKQDLWYADLYPLAKGNWDGVAVHPYADSAWCKSSSGCFTGGNMGNVTNVRATMNANGDRGKKIWTTEQGFPTARADVGDANQGQWLTDLFTGWYDQGTARGATGPMMWYTGFDTGTTGNEPTFGIIRTNGTTKPAYAALQAWTD
jgi:hypothetical protein